MKKLIIVLGLVFIGAGSWWLLGHPGYSYPVTQMAEEKTEVALGEYAGKKILYVDSYHEGYEWSDGVTAGIRAIIEPSGAELKVVRMDTKRHPEEDFKKSAALEVKATIESFKPDVVITSDDNAFKYVVKEYYRDAELPFVFNGLNWDAAVYEAPYKNTTGMVEVSLNNQIIEQIKGFAKGNRIGYISADNETERKNLQYSSSLLGITFAKSYLVKDFTEWKAKWKQLQKEVDIILFENNAGIANWNNDEAKAFALAETKIPTGTTNAWIMDYALLGITKIAEEQGEWSADAALQILDGASPSSIPVTKNKRGKLSVNLGIAEKLGVVFAPSILKNAEIIK
jgi:ABC-type uncharacterized transport system substrate-binding protein